MIENAQRQQRILDAAADLIVHYGYDKTTVSDIANAAGVSKGAIYLHFDSKDALFEALLVRELTVYSTRWMALVEDDPQGGSIGAMYKNILTALDENPFMGAMFKQDRRVLGSYLRKPDNFFRRQDANGRKLFVELMQQAGVMRADLDAAVVAHIMNMLAYGLVAMDEIMPADAIPPTDAIIAGIAQMMDAAFTPPGGVDHAAGKAVVRNIFEATRAQHGGDAAADEDPTP